MPAIIPEYQQQTRASSGSNAIPLRNPQAEAEGFFALARVIDDFADRKAQAEASTRLSEARIRLAEVEDEELNRPAEEATEELTRRVMKRFGEVRSEAMAGANRRTQAYLRARLDDIEAGTFERSLNREAFQRVQVIDDELDRAVTAGARAVELRPTQLDPVLNETLAAIDAQRIDAATRSRLRVDAIARITESAERGIALAMPAETLARLQRPDEQLDRLTPEQRDRIQQAAENRMEEQEAERILQLYRGNVRTGDAGLAALDESGLPLERQDGIRRRVREGVSLLHSERSAEHLDRVTRLESRIATGAEVDMVQAEIGILYRVGALSPAQYTSFIERAEVNAVANAEAQAARREILVALQAGIPLDPRNSDHRKFLESAFASDAQYLTPTDPAWRALALGYAGQVRMLPPQASGWLRSAARSPDPAIATAGAEFYGALEQQSPEAAGDLDVDTRAFLGQLAGMVEAGARPLAAFETARANVFEARKDVRDARDAAYREHAKTSESALTSFIDRDFDPDLFTAQPGATQLLRADFDRQSAAYFSKVGDITLARDLAWQDIRRVYGTTRVNGDAVVTAFPIERFGFTPEEVRESLADYLVESGRSVKADDVLIVPDGLTLRAAYDAMSGKPIMPSWRLVTKTGDLVLDKEGVPVRFTLPEADELTRRIEQAQARDRAAAEAAVQAARERRAREEASERHRRELGLGITPR